MILNAKFHEANNVLDADFGDVSINKVDQGFNPNSTNAQSGKAIAPIFANALKGSASSEKAVAVNDVSLIEHELGVKVTRTDTVTTTLATTPSQGFQQYSQIYFSPTLKVEENDVLTVSCHIETDDTSISSVKLTFVNVNNQSIGYVNILANTGALESATFIAKDPSTEPNYEVAFIIITDAVSGVISTLDVIRTTVEEVTPEGATISRYGKNLFDHKAFINYCNSFKSGWASEGEWLGEKVFAFKNSSPSVDFAFMKGFFKENTQYTLTLYSSFYYGSNTTYSMPVLSVIYTDGTSETIASNQSSKAWTQIKFTTKASKTVSHFKIPNFTSSASIMLRLDIQLEVGNVRSPIYEPYIEPITATADAEGNVEGLTSLSPNMTLVADTEGVVIDLEYNRNINTAFAELTQAIISLGGNV